MDTTVAPASDNQVTLIRNLSRERQFTITDDEIAALTGGRDGTATAIISKLFALPKPEKAKAERSQFTPEVGYYNIPTDDDEDRLVRVFVSKDRGQWYAKVARPERGGDKLHWSYLGKRISFKGAQPLTAEQASELVGYELGN